MKSDTRGLNRDAYAALDTKQNPYITFELGEFRQAEARASGYLVEVSGKLTISGYTSAVGLQAVCTTGGRQKVSCEGSYSLNMTDYEVEPPTAMLGLLKAGEEVTVNYLAVFRL